MVADNVVFNFALLIMDSEFNEYVSRYSRDVCRGVDGCCYALGDASLPHITIAQFPAQRAEAERLLEQARPLLHTPVTVNFRGLLLDRWRLWDALWLRVKPDPILHSLQSALIHAIGERDYVNGTGQDFDPHLTLGAWPHKDLSPPWRVDPSLINRQGVETSLELGISGQNYQFSNVIS